MDKRIRRVKWALDDDGGGEIQVLVDLPDSDQAVDRKYTFGSLDDLPPIVAEFIRKDGRKRGVHWLD